jgi:hypothetical protein
MTRRKRNEKRWGGGEEDGDDGDDDESRKGRASESGERRAGHEMENQTRTQRETSKWHRRGGSSTAIVFY